MMNVSIAKLCKMPCQPKAAASGALAPAPIALNKVIENVYRLVSGPTRSGKWSVMIAGTNTLVKAIAMPSNNVPAKSHLALSTRVKLPTVSKSNALKIVTSLPK